LRDFPGIILVATIWAYWFGVGMMIARVRRETRTLAGLIPEQRQERLMWLIWVPFVVAWIVIPYLALVHARAPWAIEVFWRSDPGYASLRWVAALCAVGSLLLTSRCWSRMGGQWRMDVGIARQGELITDGPFRYVRHPIYALSRLLMACSLVVVPTWPMLALALVHFGLTELKARHEELHLSSVHGAAYRDYVARTGRFLPRPRSMQRGSSASIRRPRTGEEP
jgi:protein-S-isoprenylcysteine O-methyltransferase Ste14